MGGGHYGEQDGHLCEFCSKTRVMGDNADGETKTENYGSILI